MNASVGSITNWTKELKQKELLKMYVHRNGYENNKSVPTSKTLKKLAQALEIDVKEFLNESFSTEKIKDEDLDKKIKNFFSEDSDNRYALDKIF